MEAWIQHYADGYDRLAAAIEGVQEDLLAYKPDESKWSIKEVAIHVCDTEINAIHRMKKILAEENPLFFKFDPDLWASRLDYANLDLALHMQLFKLLRESMVPILRQLKEEDWNRTGVHNVAGKVTFQDLVQMFSNHVDRHIQQIDRNKQAYRARG